MKTYFTRRFCVKCFGLLALTFAIVPEHAQRGAAQTSQKVEAKLCDLLANPLKYGGQIVSVRARVQTSYHSVILVDENCKTALLLEWPNSPSDLQRDAEYAKFENALHNRKRDDPTELGVRLVATFRGRFESVLEKKPDGTYVRKPQGFGHLNAAPQRLLLKEVSNVEISYTTRGDG